jgi:hypothetical protein
MSEKDFRLIELNPEERDALLARLKPVLELKDYELVEHVFHTLGYLTDLLDQQGTTIRHLRKLLAGFKSERLRKIREEIENGSDAEKNPQPEKSLEPEKGPESPGGEGKPEGSEPSGDGTPSDSEAPPPTGDGEGEGKKDEGAPEEGPKEGHGRNGADKYEGAETILVPHESLKPGDPCPIENCKGRLNECLPPRVLVRMTGQPPVRAMVVKLQRLRCGLCNTIFTAKMAEGLGTEKYDATAASIIALLRYGTGVPFYRLERLQKNFRIPVPDATQWDIVESAVKPMLPVYRALLYEAAQGQVVYNDDTGGKVLDLMKENEEKKGRKADDG